MEDLAVANGDTETEVLPEGAAVVDMVGVLTMWVRATLSSERMDSRPAIENSCGANPLIWS